MTKFFHMCAVACVLSGMLLASGCAAVVIEGTRGLAAAGNPDPNPKRAACKADPAMTWTTHDLGFHWVCEPKEKK